MGQEVGLVLVRILGPHQVGIAIFIAHQVSVVPRRHVIGPQLGRVFDKGLELDFLVTNYIGVRRPALLVFINKVREDPVPVFFFKVDRVVRNPNLTRNFGDVLVIFRCRTNPIFIGIIPVFHEDAHDIIALALEQEGRDTGVHAPAHPHDNPGLTVISHAFSPSFLIDSGTNYD